MNILSTFKIHPLFYVFALISCLTGMFHAFVIFTSIIFIHEMGHVLAGIILKIYPEKIMILPFGGLTVFRMPINISINKELFIATMGPLVQLLFFLFFHEDIYKTYNLFILVFNLLPIYPLDGSKIINLLMNKLTSFKKAFFVSLYLSFISMIIFLFLQNGFNLGWTLIISFLFFKCLDEFKNFASIFNKFLYERYINNFRFKKIKIINSKFSMKRDYEHLFKINDNLIKERDFLKKRFDFKDKT